MTRLEDISILTTGGISGLGAVAAVLKAQKGATLAIAARRESESLKIVKSIRDAGDIS